MKSYYISRGHTGDLVVSSLEPDLDDYVQGPFADHHDAFDRMQEMQRGRSRRAAAVEVLWPTASVLVVTAIARATA